MVLKYWLAVAVENRVPFLIAKLLHRWIEHQLAVRIERWLFPLVIQHQALAQN